MQKAPSVDFMRHCRDCGATVCFSNSVTGPTGQRIPLDPKNLTRHQCEPQDFYMIANLKAHVELVKSKLPGYTVELVIKENGK